MRDKELLTIPVHQMGLRGLLVWVALGCLAPVRGAIVLHDGFDNNFLDDSVNNNPGLCRGYLYWSDG